MALHCENKDGVGLVTFVGSLSAPIVDSVRDQFAGWFERHPGVKQVVVDLGGVNFMDSLGLGALIAIYKRVAERGGEMRLARPLPVVKMVLEITRTSRILPILATLDEAMTEARG